MKRNLFVITEEEKRRILGLHESATKRQYLSEQEQYFKDTTGKVQKTTGPVLPPAGTTPITKDEYDAAMKTGGVVQPAGPQNNPAATTTPTTATTTPTTGTTGTTTTSKFGVDYKYNYPGDKSYVYGYKDGKWYTKNVAKNAEFDLSTNPKWKSTIDNLNKQFTSQIKEPTTATTTPTTGTTTPTTGTTTPTTGTTTPTTSNSPVKYPWIGADGLSSLTSLQKSKDSDPNFNNWLGELKKLNQQQLTKVQQDLRSFANQISQSGIKVGSDQSYLVADQAIKDALNLVGKNA